MVDIQPMGIIGSGVASSVAGTSQAERIETRAKEKPEQAKRAQKRRQLRDQDHVDVEVTETETAEAVRNLKSNDQEEAHEDHQKHANYTLGGKLSKTKKPPPKLDLKG